MRAAKLIAGLGLVVLAAWAARAASTIFSAYDRFRARESQGSIVRHTLIVDHHALTGWQIPAAIVLLAVCALGLFATGCWLAFSILREAEKGKG